MILDGAGKPIQVDAVQVGRRLTSLRALKGLTQEQLAEKANVHPATVWRAEQGKFSVVTLIRLNEVLGSSHDYILLGKGAADGVQ